MQRISRRWATRFGGFVSSMTVESLRRELVNAGHPLTARAVYKWVAGDTMPTLPVAVEICRVSRGAVSVEDILRHAQEVRADGAGSGRESSVAEGAQERHRRD